MKFNLLNRFLNLGRYSKPALLVLTITLIVTGGLLIGGGATVQNKFTTADATIIEDNGKRVRAKPGFELIQRGANGVVARKKGQTTHTTPDVISCTCFEFTSCERTTKRPCCNHKEGETGSCTATNEGGQSFSCKGSCDQCKWK